MKKILMSGVVAGVVLLLVSFGLLYILTKGLTTLAEEYYSPSFHSTGERNIYFFLHPFILGLALAWFWERFKGQFVGVWVWRGLEMGLVYAIVATLPAMWITFSAIDVSLNIVLTWLLYGFLQATIAGLIFAKMNP